MSFMTHRSQFKCTSNCVPYPRNLDNLTLVVDAINNPIRSDNDFSDSWNAVLRNNSAKLRKGLQLLSLCDEAISERFCAGRAVA
jgi:hypothetical protein